MWLYIYIYIYIYKLNELQGLILGSFSRQVDSEGRFAVRGFGG